MNRQFHKILLQSINYFGFFLFAISCIYPFYYLFLASVSDPNAVAKGEVILWPVGFSLVYYVRIFMLKGIFSAFLISTGRTVIGTAITLFFSSMLAYVVTNKNLVCKKLIYRGTIFTMYASAGLIPWFITMKSLGLQNNFLLYVLPSAVAPFTVILVKTYIESISPFLEESAIIDGAGYFTTFTKIIIPVVQPVIVAMAVFSAVSQWNSWQDNFFLVNRPNLQTMQYILMGYLREAEMLARAIQTQGSSGSSFIDTIKSYKLSTFTIKTTITMVTVIPILVVYPLLQKYFVQGIMVGAIKG